VDELYGLLNYQAPQYSAGKPIRSGIDIEPAARLTDNNLVRSSGNLSRDLDRRRSRNIWRI